MSERWPYNQQLWVLLGDLDHDRAGVSADVAHGLTARRLRLTLNVEHNRGEDLQGSTLLYVIIIIIQYLYSALSI